MKKTGEETTRSEEICQVKNYKYWYDVPRVLPDLFTNTSAAATSLQIGTGFFVERMQFTLGDAH